MQINTNHSKPAQDAAYRFAIERNMALICISEPHNTPQNYQYIGEKNGLAVIFWNPRIITGIISNLKIKKNFVIIRIDKLIIISMYISPNISLEIGRAHV